MGNTLLGIPLVFWGAGCLAIAVAYFWFWPQQNPKPARQRSTWQHVVLRYFHSLVWLLLAAGCFAAGAGYGSLGIWLALAALPVYIIFMIVLFQDRQQETAAASAAKRAPAEGKQPG